MIFAHRGASLYAPENTLAAFEIAIEQKADAIEFDVNISADGCLVVIHDDTVDRTTNGSGKVRELNQKDLQQLDAGSFFHRTFKGEHIPTLEDIFTHIRNRIFLNIELKDKDFIKSSLQGKVLDLLHKYDLTESVLISSFNINVLRSIHNKLPEVAIAILADRRKQGIISRCQIGLSLVKYQAWHTKFKDATPKLVKKQHSLGHRVNAYTVDQPDDIRSLLHIVIDGVFTNDPLVARQVFNQYQISDQEIS